MVPLQAIDGQELGSLFLLGFVLFAVTYTIYRFFQGYGAGKA